MTTISPDSPRIRRESEFEGIPQSILDSYSELDELNQFYGNHPGAAAHATYKDTSHRDDPGAGIAEYADVPEPVLQPAAQATAPVQAPPTVTPPVVKFTEQPTTAVVEAQEVQAGAVAAQEKVAMPVSSSVKRPKFKNVKRSNLRLAAIAAIVLAVTIPVGGHTLSLTGLIPGASASQAKQEASTVPAATVIETDQEAAISFYAAHGTFNGYQPLEGGQSLFTSVGATAVFGRQYDGVCYVYAVTDGQATVSNQDPTGQGCSQAGIDAAHAQLKQLQP